MIKHEGSHEHGKERTWYRRPQALRPGDTVGVVAPASPVDPSRLEAGIKQLKRRGFNVRVGGHVFGRSSLFSGSDRDRAEDISRMLEDTAIRAVFCARGGYGSQRLLPLLASLVDKVPPKIIVGYSDITALHCLFLRSGWVTWHAPMPGDWATMADQGFSLEVLFSLLSGQTTEYIPLPPGTRPTTLRTGQARGRLVGGNLSLLAALLGTQFEVETSGAILFLEDIGEAPYRIDRMLSSLRLAGKLTDVRGVILGDFTDCHPQPGAPPVSVDEVLRSHFADLDVPVILGYPAGHGRVNIPLPLGHEVEIDAERGQIAFATAPVRS